MRKCAEEKLNESKKRSSSIGLNSQVMRIGMKIPKIGLRHQHPKKGRNRKSRLRWKEKKPLVHIKTTSTEEKTGNVPYAMQKTTVDITTVPNVKEFTPRIDRTK